MKRPAFACQAAVIVLLAACSRNLAATAETADSGGSQPTPVPGSTAETGWNPQIQCTVQSEETIFDLLECLGAGIDPTFPCSVRPELTTQSPTGGPGPVQLEQNPNPTSQTYCPFTREDYKVSWLPAPRIGIQILRLDNTEVDSLFLRENDPSIQWTKLEVLRAGLVAKIGEIQEHPSSGFISVTLNNRPIVVQTAGLDPAGANAALVAQIRNNGFVVTHEPPYIVVWFDRSAGLTLTQVGFRSMDPLITRSELRLEPPGSDAPLLENLIVLPGGGGVY